MKLSKDAVMLAQHDTSPRVGKSRHLQEPEVQGTQIEVLIVSMASHQESRIGGIEVINIYQRHFASPEQSTHLIAKTVSMDIYVSPDQVDVGYIHCIPVCFAFFLFFSLLSPSLAPAPGASLTKNINLTIVRTLDISICSTWLLIHASLFHTGA